jgi:hypothetical protein
MSQKKGRTRKNIRESEWLRVNQPRSNVRAEISKIVKEVVDPVRVREIWPKLSPQEKLDLCVAYHSKLHITKADEEVLDLIMEQGDEPIWNSIASVLTRHTDGHRIAVFLSERIEKQTPPIGNFCHALEIIKAKESVPHLLKRLQEFEAVGASPSNPNRLLNFDYLYCCSALWKLTSSGDYANRVKPFLAADDDLVRSAAKRILSPVLDVG